MSPAGERETADRDPVGKRVRPGLGDQADRLVELQPSATAYVIADMKALFDTASAPEAVRALCDVAWSVRDEKAAILAEQQK